MGENAKLFKVGDALIEARQEIHKLNELLAQCAPYLQEGETPAQCITRGLADFQRMIAAEIEALEHVTELRHALDEAARSLQTIAEQGGKTDYMSDIGEVRAYARSRATVAQEALQGAERTTDLPEGFLDQDKPGPDQAGGVVQEMRRPTPTPYEMHEAYARAAALEIGWSDEE